MKTSSYNPKLFKNEELSDLDLFLRQYPVWVERQPKAVNTLKKAVDEGLITSAHLKNLHPMTIKLFVGGLPEYPKSRDNGIIALREQLVTPEAIDDLVWWCMDNKGCNFEHVGQLFTDAGLFALQTKLIIIEQVTTILQANGLESLLREHYVRENKDTAPEEPLVNAPATGGCCLS